MIITEAPTLADLTIGTLYNVTFGVRQHKSTNIKVTAVSSGIASITFYDTDGTTQLDTVSLLVTVPVWIIDLTK
jgi:hypothetical protein